MLSSSPITILKATEENTAHLARLFEYIEGQNVTTAFIQTRLEATRGQETPFLAERDAQVIGLACLRLNATLSSAAPYAEVTELFVQPAHRGQGIEESLLRHIETYASQQGAQQLILHTGLKNTTAQELYRSLGYREYTLAMHKRLPQPTG